MVTEPVTRRQSLRRRGASQLSAARAAVSRRARAFAARSQRVADVRDAEGFGAPRRGA